MRPIEFTMMRESIFWITLAVGIIVGMSVCVTLVHAEDPRAKELTLEYARWYIKECMRGTQQAVKDGKVNPPPSYEQAVTRCEAIYFRNLERYIADEERLIDGLTKRVYPEATAPKQQEVPPLWDHPAIKEALRQQNEQARQRDRDSQAYFDGIWKSLRGETAP